MPSMSTPTAISTPAPAPPLPPSDEVSSTRLYLGNLPKDVTKQDVEDHFGKHGTGDIVEIKLMNGFGFIEYRDALDARDVVPAFHGSNLLGSRLIVQFARGPRPRENNFNQNHNHHHHQERPTPRPRRTAHRMTITGLPSDTSWQDLKDFARRSGLEVVFSETSRNGEGSVEFESAQDLNVAIDKLNNTEFRDKVVACVAATHMDMPPRDPRGRSRSPNGRRPYGARDDYDRRPPPPMRGDGYSPRRDGYRDNYRDRGGPRRDYYDDRMRYPSPPPPRRGPIDDYPPPPPRARYDDPYRRGDYPPGDPYVNPRGPYDRPPPPPPMRDFPARDVPYAREGGYPRDYDRRYW